MRPKQSCCVTEAVPIFIALMLVSAIAAQPAQAQTFKVLHTFHGPDGASPFGGVVRAADGTSTGRPAAVGRESAASSVAERRSSLIRRASR